MNKYTLTEVIYAKKVAFKLGLFLVAAQYRNLECEMKGISRPNHTLLSKDGAPKGLYIDLRDLIKSCDDA